MKILLFGRNGQVGWELQRSLAPLGQVIAPSSSDADGDFRRPEGLARTVLQVRPDVVVNAAAYTAVDKAESERDLAFMLNAEAPAAIAAAAQQVGAVLLHFSTDYVFDGSGSRPWEEGDPTGPLNVYGRSKLEGEQRIAAALPRHLILRTSWVYAVRGANFPKTMLRLARERESLEVVDDQFGAPTGAELLADVSAHLLRAFLARPETAGIYHVAAAGETTWHAYARFVLATVQAAGGQLKAGPGQVKPVPGSAFPAPAARPHNSRLNTARLRSVFGLELPAWENGVARMLQEIC